MGRLIELSKRMQAVADMVSAGSRVCEVGCDHGYVSIYLVQSKKAPHVLAMDVNRGPLSKAKEHVRKYQAEDYITLRLSNGLAAYQEGEADTLLCSGMGGRLLMDILMKDAEKTAGFRELVLQPQSEVPLFRKFLREKGYIFIMENMVLEDGKFYPMMKVKRKGDSGCALDDKMAEDMAKESYKMEDMLGPLLLKERHPVLFQFIRREISIKQGILSQLQSQKTSDKITNRKTGLLKELDLLRKAEQMWNQ